MNKIITVLICSLLFLILPMFALSQTNLSDSDKSSDSEKCTTEIEGLKFCVKSSEITVNSGEPINIEFTWNNSSGAVRRVGLKFVDYSLIIKNEKGKKLNTVLEQLKIDGEKRIKNNTATEEDKKGFIVAFRGSGRSTRLAPGETQSDRVIIDDYYFGYNYDLTEKGKYKVTVSRTVPSLEKGKIIEFLIDGIEITVN